MVEIQGFHPTGIMSLEILDPGSWIPGIDCAYGRDYLPGRYHISGQVYHTQAEGLITKQDYL